MELLVILASIIQGIHKAIGLTLILFGAIFLMNILKENGAVDRINIGFNRLNNRYAITSNLDCLLIWSTH